VKLALGLALGLLPALYELRLRRILLSLLDDPTLASRVVLSRTTRLLVASLAAVAVVAATAQPAAAAAPFAVAWVASAHTRRRVYDETWGVVARTRQAVGFVAVYLGPSVLAGVVPLLCAPLGWLGVPVGLLAFATGIAWLTSPTRVARLLLHHELVPNAALRADLQAVSDRATCPAPASAMVGLPGGVLASAIAVADERRPASLLGRTLVDELPPDQVLALHAHGLAHLEQRRGAAARPARLRVVALLVVGALLSPPLLAVVDHPLPLALGIAAACFAALLVGRPIGAAGTPELDRRAVELGAAPQALLDALVALHARSLLPRQPGARAEARAAPPSLAPRIQALRAEFDLPVPARPAPTWVRGHTRGELVWLGPDRLVAFQKLSAEQEEAVLAAQDLDAACAALPDSCVRAFPLAELVDLQLAPHMPRGRSLMFARATGRAETVRLADQELAAATAWMEHADTQLAPNTDRVLRQGRILARTTAGLVGLLIVVGVGPGFLAPVVVAALLLPRQGVVAAFAFGTVSAGGMALAVPDFALPWWQVPTFGTLWVVLGFLGVLAARASGPAAGWETAASRTLALALLGAAMFFLAPHAAFAGDLDQLALALRSRPEGIALGLGGAAALASASRPERAVAVVLLLPLCAALAMATPLGLRGVGDDPLLQRPSAVEPPSSTPALRWHRDAPDGWEPAWIRVAPGGAAIAVGRSDAPVEPLADPVQADQAGGQWAVGRASGAWRLVPALDLQWLDHRFVTVRRQGNGGVVQIDGAAPIAVPLLDHPRLFVHAGGFVLVDREEAGSALLRVDGAFDGSPPRIQRRELAAPTAAGWGHSALPGPGERFVFAERRRTWSSDPPGPRQPFLATTTLHLDGADGPAATELPLSVDRFPDGSVAVAADDGGRTAIWRWSEAGLDPVCALPFPRPDLHVAPDGTAALLATGRIFVGDAASCDFVRVPDVPRCRYTQAVGAAHGATGLVSSCGGAYRVHVYEGR